MLRLTISESSPRQPTHAKKQREGNRDGIPRSSLYFLFPEWKWGVGGVHIGMICKGWIIDWGGGSRDGRGGGAVEVFAKGSISMISRK